MCEVKKIGILLACIVWSTQNVYATLDGTVTPIYLDARYSLTPYELVRGNVYFKDGFDLPPNGTVIINITQQVGGDIVMNNGTLILDDHLKLGPDVAISGSGYLQAEDKTLFFLRDKLITDGIIVTSNIIFDGQGKGSILINSGNVSLAFTNNVSRCVFKDMFFRTPLNSRFFTTDLAPSRLEFDNTLIDLRGVSSNFNSTFVVFKNACFLRGREGKSLTITNTFILDNQGELSIGQGLELNVNEVLSGDEVTGIVLDSARLVYTNTSPLFPLFRQPSLSAQPRGRLTINGQSQLSGPEGVALSLSEQSIIQCNAGASLSLEPGTHLIIE